MPPTQPPPPASVEEQQCTSMCSGSSPAFSPARPKVTVPFPYGDTTSVSYLSQDTMVRGRPASFRPSCLVDPIDQAGSKVERRKIPILEIVLRVGEVSEAETPMAAHVIVDATRDRPLRAGTFD